MKVVCRVIYHSLTYLKEYDVIEKEERPHLSNLAYYQLLEQTPYVKVKNDKDLKLWYKNKYFFSAQELRRRKLRKLKKIQ